MGSSLLRVSALFAMAPDLVLKARRRLLAAIILLTAFLLYGLLAYGRFDVSYDSFLDAEDPAILALNEYRRQFGSDDNLYLVYEAIDGDVFSRQSLEAVRRLTEDLENWQSLDPADYAQTPAGEAIDLNELKHLRRIQSITNLRVQSNEADTLRSERLIPIDLPESDAELAAIKADALAEDDYLLAFYSADARYGAIMIQTDFGAMTKSDFVPAVDAQALSLDMSFDSFAFEGDGAGLDYDETAEVDERIFEPMDMFGYTEFYNAAKSVFSKYDTQLRFSAVGNPPLMGFLTSVLLQLQTLGAGVIAVFAFLLWALFRSASAVIWPVTTILVSIIWMWGTTVWLGVATSQMIGLSCLLVFAVGIANCIHVMSAYFYFKKEGVEHRPALSQAYGKTGLAILVASLTTMAGVLALTTSEIVPIKVFSVMSAFGVLVAFLASLLLLPLLLDIWHPGAAADKLTLAQRLGARWKGLGSNARLLLGLAYCAALVLVAGVSIGGYLVFTSFLAYFVINWGSQTLSRLPYYTQRFPMLILAIFATTFFVCAYGTSKLKIDSNMTELTRVGNPMRVAYDIVDQNMAGAQMMVIMIDSQRSDGMLEPAVMRAIDALQSRIESRYSDQVTRTYSLANIVKDTNEIMNDGDPAFYRIPDSQQMISQLLYLFNSANPEDRRSLVSDDYSRASVSLNIYNAGSYEYEQFFARISEDIDEIFLEARAINPELDVYLTGSMALLMRLADEVASSQFSSFSLAFAVVSVIMILALGSLQAGLIAMVPNLIPALLSFGLMGLLGISLDIDTLLIAPLIMGIAVDDTIHFMTHYRVELLKTRSIERALRSAIEEVGQAVMFTTLVLGLGFALLSFSDYLGMAKMGFFGALAIFIALLCDLFLIPAMIIVFRPTLGIEKIDTHIEFSKEGFA